MTRRVKTNVRLFPPLPPPCAFPFPFPRPPTPRTEHGRAMVSIVGPLSLTAAAGLGGRGGKVTRPQRGAVRRVERVERPVVGSNEHRAAARRRRRGRSRGRGTSQEAFASCACENCHAAHARTHAGAGDRSTPKPMRADAERLIVKRRHKRGSPARGEKARASQNQINTNKTGGKHLLGVRAEAREGYEPDGDEPTQPAVGVFQSTLPAPVEASGDGAEVVAASRRSNMAEKILSFISP